MISKIEFHEDMSQLKDKIHNILKGPLKKEDIYFVNGESPEFTKELSFMEKMKISKNKIQNDEPQTSSKSNIKLK